MANDLFKSTVAHYGLSLSQAADVLSMTRQTMGNIFAVPPRTVVKPYLAHALVAGIHKLNPLSSEETLDYVNELGVSRAVTHNWRQGQAIPHQARLAAAFHKTQREN